MSVFGFFDGVSPFQLAPASHCGDEDLVGEAAFYVISDIFPF
jgi:hypothetical protein